MEPLNGCTDIKRKFSLMVVPSHIFLHEWWLVKADPDSHGKRLSIGGFTLKENQGIKSFSSAAIIKRHDAVTLQTVDGTTLMVQGYLNRSRTLENGFSEEMCDHFLIGFPYNWEDFAALSVSEEPDYSTSKGVSLSQEALGTNTYEFDPSIVAQSMDSADHTTKKARKKMKAFSNVASAGPMTRSRARLLGEWRQLSRG